MKSNRRRKITNFHSHYPVMIQTLVRWDERDVRSRRGRRIPSSVASSGLLYSCYTAKGTWSGFTFGLIINEPIIATKFIHCRLISKHLHTLRHFINCEYKNISRIAALNPTDSSCRNRCHGWKKFITHRDAITAWRKVIWMIRRSILSRAFICVDQRSGGLTTSWRGYFIHINYLLGKYGLKYLNKSSFSIGYYLFF